MKKHNLLFLILGLSLGFILGLTIKNWPYLILDPKVEIIDIVSICLGLITLYIGYHIASTLDRDKKKEEYKHDFLMHKLAEFRSLTVDLSNTINKNSCQDEVICFKLKSINQEYSDFYDSLDFCGLEITEIENNSMKSELLKLKQLCTSHRRMKEGENIIKFTDSLELQIENRIYIYSQVRVDEIKKKIRLLSNQLFQYTIN